METINDRVIKMVNQLANGKQTDFCERAGIFTSTLNAIIKKKQLNPSLETLEKICSAYPISKSWFYTGEGNMLASSEKFDCQQEILKLQKEIEFLKKREVTLMRTVDRLLGEESPKFPANLLNPRFAVQTVSV